MAAILVTSLTFTAQFTDDSTNRYGSAGVGPFAGHQVLHQLMWGVLFPWCCRLPQPRCIRNRRTPAMCESVMVNRDVCCERIPTLRLLTWQALGGAVATIGGL
jgi:hypothetical protein